MLGPLGSALRDDSVWPSVLFPLSRSRPNSRFFTLCVFLPASLFHRPSAQGKLLCPFPVSTPRPCLSHSPSWPMFVCLASCRAPSPEFRTTFLVWCISFPVWFFSAANSCFHMHVAAPLSLSLFPCVFTHPHLPAMCDVCNQHVTTQKMPPHKWWTEVVLTQAPCVQEPWRWL